MAARHHPDISPARQAGRDSRWQTLLVWWVVYHVKWLALRRELNIPMYRICFLLLLLLLPYMFTGIILGELHRPPLASCSPRQACGLPAALGYAGVGAPSRRSCRGVAGYFSQLIQFIISRVSHFFEQFTPHVRACVCVFVHPACPLRASLSHCSVRLLRGSPA